MNKIVVVGYGKMAKAICDGLRDDFEIELVGRDLQKAKKFKDELNLECSIYELKNYDISEKIVLLCVKPYAIDDVSKELIGQANVLISILAGTRLEKLKSKISANYVIRAMPNVAAQYKKSITTITGDILAKDVAVEVLSKIGQVVWLNSEKELDIATALGGSAPAFLSIVAESLIDGGVKEGLKRDDATVVVNTLFEGFSYLLKDIHPALIKESVMSPGGTTAEGVFSLEHDKIRSAFMKAIHKTNLKAKELSKI
ncbi:MAG: pyrroline-5-carboxylate reductase [Campylobacterales bacterium]|nr:pyrroline-5-carboxylate reductase [Campylobacterales bacterium]